jgi:hypothetical protein
LESFVSFSKKKSNAENSSQRNVMPALTNVSLAMRCKVVASVLEMPNSLAALSIPPRREGSKPVMRPSETKALK